MGKIKLWTTQDIRSLKEIEDNETYRVSESSIIGKYTDCSDVYLKVYRWFSKEADKYMKRPEGVKYPVWAALKKEETHGLVDGYVRYELEVDETEVLILDAGKWDYILNYWYIPKDEKDKDNFRNELEQHGITNQSKIMLTNFYPMLSRKITDSWNRLFDNSIKISEIKIAAIWDIKRKDILNIEDIDI